LGKPVERRRRKTLGLTALAYDCQVALIIELNSFAIQSNDAIGEGDGYKPVTFFM
jgi:hypothetical protein